MTLQRTKWIHMCAWSQVQMEPMFPYSTPYSSRILASKGWNVRIPLSIPINELSSLKTISAVMKNKLYRRDQIICLICTSSFFDIEAFNRHHYNFHELQQIFCEICGKEMKSLWVWKLHFLWISSLIGHLKSISYAFCVLTSQRGTLWRCLTTILKSKTCFNS